MTSSIADTRRASRRFYLALKIDDLIDQRIQCGQALTLTGLREELAHWLDEAVDSTDIEDAIDLVISWYTNRQYSYRTGHPPGGGRTV